MKRIVGWLFLLGLLVVAGFSVPRLLLSAREPSPSQSEMVTRDGSALLGEIVKAAGEGQARYVIPPGVYRIPGGPVAEGKEGCHWELIGLKDLEIDATGAVLIFAERGQHAIIFRNCRNVTLRGATLRRETPGFSQGRIEAIDPAGGYVDVRIDAGYPLDIDDVRFFPHFWSNVFEKDTGRWKTQLRAPTPYVMKHIEPDLVRIDTREIATTVPRIQPGDRLAWRGAVRDDIRLSRCAGMKILGVTIQGGAGMALHEMGGDGGNVYRDCKVTYCLKPSGAMDAPLIATNADGLHSSDVRQGPVIEGCLFEGVDDDAIAIHGNYSLVLEADGTRMVVCRFSEASNPLGANPGDLHRFYDRQGAFVGEARVVQARPVPGFVPATRPDAMYRVFQKMEKNLFVEYTLDRPVAAGEGWLASNQDTLGKGFVVRGNTIRDCFARGILPKSIDGTIEGNLIERTARAAIELLPEMTWWSESDYCRNVVIRGNTIRDVSPNRKTGPLRHPGALTIFAYRESGYTPAPGGHRDIVVEDNLFDDNSGPNILVAAASGVLIKDNRFVRPMSRPSDFGKDKGVDPSALIWLQSPAGVTLEGNVIEQPGSHLRTLAASPGQADLPVAGIVITEAGR
jgi:hypothetical protein